MLRPLDFLVVSVLADPPIALELSRSEDETFHLLLAPLPAEPGLSEDQRSALARLGLADQEGGWISTGAIVEAAAAATLVEQVLGEVFAAKEPVAVDVDHGSRRPLAEAQRKLEAIRKRVESNLTEMLGRPPAVDADGDYVIGHGSTEVYVSPLALPNMPAVIRVFAITNVGLTVTPELGLFLARLNFGLMFGRFALDTDHRAVWFSETLLGEAFSDEELRFTIGVVAQTAGDWDLRIAQMFGGFTPATMPHDEDRPVPAKPGQGGAPDRAGYL